MVEPSKTSKFSKKKRVLLTIIPWVVIVVIAIIVVVAVKKTGKACDPLTPLILERFSVIGGEKPVSGERCWLSSEESLVNISYDSSQDAQNARMGLVAGTSGERKRLGDYDWVAGEGNSSVFKVDGSRISIFVVLNKTDREEVESLAAKILK